MNDHCSDKFHHVISSQCRARSAEGGDLTIFAFVVELEAFFVEDLNYPTEILHKSQNCGVQSNALLCCARCSDLRQSQSEWKTNRKCISAVKISEKREKNSFHSLNSSLEQRAVQFCSIFFSSLLSALQVLHTIFLSSSRLVYTNIHNHHQVNWCAENII